MGEILRDYNYWFLIPAALAWLMARAQVVMNARLNYLKHHVPTTFPEYQRAMAEFRSQKFLWQFIDLRKWKTKQFYPKGNYE